MSIHPVMQRLADKLKRTDLPAFVPGDQIRVQVKIKEGDKERLQAFEGLVIAINKGPQGTFTVRKMSFGQGVERIFPFNSKVVRQGGADPQLQGASRQALLPPRAARQGRPPEGSGPRDRQSPRVKTVLSDQWSVVRTGQDSVTRTQQKIGTAKPPRLRPGLLFY